MSLLQEYEAKRYVRNEAGIANQSVYDYCRSSSIVEAAEDAVLAAQESYSRRRVALFSTSDISDLTIL